MPFLLTYILKLSVSLALVFLFYYFILRKLTFYRHNRWYLLGYTLLSFFIPLINISPVLEKNNWADSRVLTWIPALQQPAGNAPAVAATTGFSTWNILLIIIVAGMLIMLIRLLVQLWSFRRLMKKAVPLEGAGMQVYQVDAPIIPFSFGNSIFINNRLHSEVELREIIRHEFVHVKQKHSLDIIWAELLCLFCWFNPFAWLLKNAIRQNLEFIADHQVLEKGANKKEYQYLLLKVTGNRQYSIATQFNFSSLKKRIVMMNKAKSAKRQLGRLLFLLPATAVMLLAFRNKWNGKNDLPAVDQKQVAVAGLVVDAITMQPLGNATIHIKEKNITVTTDDRGYYLVTMPVETKPLHFTMLVSKKGYSPLLQTENWGNFSEAHTYDRYSKTIEFFGLSAGGKENRSFSTLAGNAPGMEGLSYESVLRKLEEVRNRQYQEDWEENEIDTMPARSTVNGQKLVQDFLKRNPDVSRVGWSTGQGDDAVRLVITRKDGGQEEYNLANDDELRKAEAKYGKLPVPPPPPPVPPAPPVVVEGRPIPPSPYHEKPVEGVPAPPPAPGEVTEVVVTGYPAPPVPPMPVKLPDNVEKLNRNGKKVTVTLKNGQTETYDLNNPDDKKKFESKYGKAILFTPAAPGRVVEEPVRASGSSSKNGKSSGNTYTVVADGNLLYVVDNVETTRAVVDAYSPSDIAAISILKGDKAIAAYGTKGKDGVVVVTTKPSVTIADGKSDPVTVAGYPAGKIHTISYTETDKLVVLDGKELSDSEKGKKLKGNFRVITLSKTDAVKKFGEKGKNGAVLITTVN